MKGISISFSKYSDANFQKKAELIYNSMNGNDAFQSLAAQVTAMKASLDQYVTDLQQAGTRDKNAVARKNQSREQLTTLLRQLGLNVVVVADGDEVVMVSSGFTLDKKPEPRYITNPGNVTLSQGLSSGDLYSTVSAVFGAKSYVHQIASELPTEQTKWTSHTSSASKYMFSSLTPGKQYWVRVAVIGSRNQVAYSNVASWFAQ
ncbi:MAG: hypothetical protein ACTHJN_18475 [Ginsengibacter sp.]